MFVFLFLFIENFFLICCIKREQNSHHILETTLSSWDTETLERRTRFTKETEIFREAWGRRFGCVKRVGAPAARCDVQPQQPCFQLLSLNGDVKCVFWGGGSPASASAVSLKIQNTRSQIPLCLRFLYTAEGNKGTTVIWLQHHGATRWWQTS